MNIEERRALRFRIGEAFSPATPIDNKDLFSGREKQIDTLIDVISQRGRHAIVYGERGVGKTSFARVFSSILKAKKQIISPFVECSSGDEYSKLWRRVFEQMTRTKDGLGFAADTSMVTLAKDLPQELDPNIVVSLLQKIQNEAIIIIMFDEFDRIQNNKTRMLSSDTIKSLSDRGVNATVVLVGVAESVNDMIKAHHSVERCLAQIRMPRMEDKELQAIVNTGLKKVDMTIQTDVLEQICALSQGLPHYTHLLAQNSARKAAEANMLEISSNHLEEAINVAIEEVQESISVAYHKSIMSTQKRSIYPQVLLACALSEHDSRGCFAAGDVREPLQHIMGKRYEIPLFIRHLNDFTNAARGSILKKEGQKYRYRYGFRQAIMEPYVIMHGLATDMIKKEDLKTFRRGILSEVKGRT